MFGDKEEIEESNGVDDFVKTLKRNDHLKYKYMVDGLRTVFTAVLVVDTKVKRSYRAKKVLVENRLKNVYRDIGYKIIDIEDVLKKERKHKYPKVHGNQGRKKTRKKEDLPAADKLGSDAEKYMKQKYPQ